MSPRALRAILALGPVLLAACVGTAPRGVPLPFGSPSGGYLAGGRALPTNGPGFVRSRPTDPTRFGTPTLVTAIERAAASVARTFPGTRPLRVGDLSSPDGGRHARHHSHRSGRDADLMYYAVDASGRPVEGVGLVAYNRFGYARDRASGNLVFLDEARVWHLVRTLVLDESAHVQWIFCSWGVKRRLLDHAIAFEPDPVAIFRASQVLHQPRDARPHDDHIHLRVACSAEERAGGCLDRGPLWPWLRSDHEKPAGAAGPAMDDAALVAELLEDEDGALRIATGAAGGAGAAAVTPDPPP